MNLFKRAALAILATFSFAGVANAAFATPSFSINDASARENAGYIYFKITKSGTSTTPSVVTVQTASRTAVSNKDYVPVAYSITFQPADVSKTVAIKLINDTVAEPVETFAVLLKSSSNATITRTTGVGTIYDDDTPVITPVSKTVNENAGTTSIHFVRTGDRSVTTTYSWALTNGTAIAGVNFVNTAGAGTFNAGSYDQYVVVKILDDKKYTGDLLFNVLVGNVTNGTAGPAATVTIHNTDPVPPVTWTKCADENGTCYVVGTANVRYGSGTTWTAPRPVTGSITCDNATWGDPLVGTVKECDTDGQVGTPPPPATQTCPDGSVIPVTQTCPVPPPPPVQMQTCPDGSVIPVTQACPAPPPPTTVTCPDGSVIPSTQTCPVAPPPVATAKCPDGGVIRGGSICPTITSWIPAPLTVGGFFCNAAQENTPNIGPCGSSIVYRITGTVPNAGPSGPATLYTAVFYQDASGQFPTNDTYHSNVTGIWDPSQMKGIAPTAMQSSITGPTVLADWQNNLMNVQQCPDEGIVYTDEVCGTLTPHALPVPSNGYWTYTANDQWNGIKAGGYAVAIQDCKSIYDNSPSYTKIHYNGAQKGVVYKVIAWGSYVLANSVADPNGNVWTLDNPSGAHAINVPQTCLVGVQ